jgi:hypothetical protein
VRLENFVPNPKNSFPHLGHLLEARWRFHAKQITNAGIAIAIFSLINEKISARIRR